MKSNRLLLVPLAFLVGCEIASQHEELFPNGKRAKAGQLVAGQQEGEWTYSYETGALKARGTFRADVQEGEWTYWFPNGNKEMEGDFRDERRTGPWQYWHANGERRAQGCFADGRETGEWTFWNANGERIQRGVFDRGKRHLGWTLWHAGGAEKASGLYCQGERIGAWRFWDAAGKLSEKHDSVPEGLALYSESWPDGTPRREGFLRNGSPLGAWSTWHENGQRRLSGSFEDDEPQGTWVATDTEGELLAFGGVQGRRLIGEWRFRNAGGERLAQREVEARPPAVWSGEWSRSNDAVGVSAEALVETWLAEINSPRERELVVALETTGASTTSSDLGAGASLRAPIRAQPWTVREEELMTTYVERYETGDTSGLRRAGYSDPGSRRRRPRGDREKSEPLLERALPITQFETAAGETLDLGAFRGQRRLLVVILRGFAGQVCVYCTTQTKALAPALSKFEKLNTEVVIVYPGPESGMDAFVEAYVNTFDDHSPPPYTLLYDPDLRLAEALELTGDLAIPTSLLLDENGIIRWAYVGRTIDDRPSTQQILEVLERLETP